MSKLPKSWTTVTGLSKILALILFILLPFIGFLLGRNFQSTLDRNLITEIQIQKKSAPLP